MICFLFIKLKVALAKRHKKTFNRAKVINKFDSPKLSFVKIINFAKINYDNKSDIRNWK